MATDTRFRQNWTCGRAGIERDLRRSVVHEFPLWEMLDAKIVIKYLSSIFAPSGDDQD